MMTRVRQYYELAKPGLIYGNLFTVIAGYLFASRWQVEFVPFCASLAGLAFVIGSACVFNNCMDRRLDAKMERTRGRATVTKDLSLASILMYGAVLGVAGFFLLYAFVNTVATAVALLGFVFYLGPYSLAKRYSHWGAVVGSVAGATPIVVGYTAATGSLTWAASILFLILMFWQMPHFYSIAVYRLDDYSAAGIPVLPARRGMARTRWETLLWLAAFIAAAVSLYAFGYAGLTYLVIAVVLCAAWFVLAVRGFYVVDEKRWARRMFFCSLIVLVLWSFVLAVSPLLP